MPYYFIHREKSQILSIFYEIIAYLRKKVTHLKNISCGKVHILTINCKFCRFLAAPLQKHGDIIVDTENVFY